MLRTPLKLAYVNYIWACPRIEQDNSGFAEAPLHRYVTGGVTYVRGGDPDWMDQETQRRHATTKKKKEDQEAPVVGSEAQRKDLEAHGMTVL